MCDKRVGNFTVSNNRLAKSVSTVILTIFLFTIVTSLFRPVRGLEHVEDGASELGGSQKYNVEGKVIVQQASDMDWVPQTRVVVDGGKYLGILKVDGSFTINNIPSGSYVLEVTHPHYVFEATRVEINSKGKIRARTLNNIQPSAVHVVNYPLKLRARGLTAYFQKREQWKITDFLFSPMVMMMLLPLGMMVLLPKLINSQDPETQREMQESMNMLTPKQNLPDLSEWLTQKLGGGSGSQSGASGAAAKKSAAKAKAIKKQ